MNRKCSFLEGKFIKCVNFVVADMGVQVPVNSFPSSFLHTSMKERAGAAAAMNFHGNHENKTCSGDHKIDVCELNNLELSNAGSHQEQQELSMFLKL